MFRGVSLIRTVSVVFIMHIHIYTQTHTIAVTVLGLTESACLEQLLGSPTMFACLLASTLLLRPIQYCSTFAFQPTFGRLDFILLLSIKAISKNPNSEVYLVTFMMG